MDRRRIGELLGSMIPLTRQDIEDILHEQEASPRRFGDIALSLGLCEPRHIWHAWAKQLESGIERVDLEQVGVDVQAIRLLPASEAREMGVLPLRVIEDRILVFACSSAPGATVVEKLCTLTSREPRWVLCDHAKLTKAIEHYYPTLARSA